MTLQPDMNPAPKKAERSLELNARAFLEKIQPLSGMETLEQILGLENPRKMVQQFSCEDLFWLVKKIGENDCIPILELASTDQWQYALDLEIWSKDRFRLGQTVFWLKLLQQADSIRLVDWLFSKGQFLAYYLFFKDIEVVIQDEDEVCDIPDGFFTVDGTFYVKPVNEEHRETIENIIRAMADKDTVRYQALLLGLSGVLPAELEEDMYRIRNVRLAEHGFLPFDEAISIYAPMNPDILRAEKISEPQDTHFDEDVPAIAPVSPMHYTGTQNMLTVALSTIDSAILLDRISLEFAGLCNQVLAADALTVYDVEALIQVSRKTAGYLNLALERLCDKDISAAQQILKTHPLSSVFRVGFGFALEVKWEAQAWLKKSWFYAQGLELNFWGDTWGAILAGLLAAKPRFYTGLKQGEEYKDFERLSEIGICLKILGGLIVLDSLFSRLADQYLKDRGPIEPSEVNFRTFLFNLWSRRLLKIEPCFSAISYEQANSFFGRLRTGTTDPPYRMEGYEDKFVNEFMSYATNVDPKASLILKETLTLIWREFCEEYEWVSVDDLDSRYSKYISIIPTG